MIMALIEFKDLPDTSTPINSNNLNNNFNECYNNVESGSNENGNYVKFSDGTLIQYGSVVQTANTDNVTITFPISFANANYTMNAMSWFQWYRSSTFTRGDKLISSVKLYILYYDSNNNWIGSTSHTPTIDWVAIGKWK